jgi:hypothetical protein
LATVICGAVGSARRNDLRMSILMIDRAVSSPGGIGATPTMPTGF